MTFLQIGQEPPFVLLYEDQTLIAVQKVAGQLFHGYTRGQPFPLDVSVKDYIRRSRGKTAGIYLGVVHRLDRPVSGVALFACNSKAAARVAEQFQTRAIDKIYLAIVEGRVSPERGQLEDMLLPPLGEGQIDRTAKGNEETAQKAQFCTLSYELLAVDGERSLLAIRLGTGRRHQIRMQLSSRGWPIAGDGGYGAQSCVPGAEEIDPRFRPIALHAAALRLTHPSSFEPLLICAELPFYWSAWGETFARASAEFLKTLS